MKKKKKGKKCSLNVRLATEGSGKGGVVEEDIARERESVCVRARATQRW